MSPEKNYSLDDILNEILNWFFSLNTLQQAVVLVIAVKILADHSPKTVYNTTPKPIPRKDFSEYTKKQTLLMQSNVCNSCKKPSKIWDFHHKDGNRSNNRPSNCEALCPYCHAEKTRGKTSYGLIF